MRLPYVPADPENDMTSEEDKAVVARVKERRDGKLIELDRALLHAPPVADGWNAFLKSIRTQTTLSPSIRETAICRVAVLNSAWYEWTAHLPLLEASLPTPHSPSSKALIAEIRHRPRDFALPQKTEAKIQARIHEKGLDRQEEGFDAAHAAVLRYTDAMTLDVKVPDDVFAELKGHFTDREVVEITATVAAYNTVSRFLVALDVGEMNEKFAGEKEV
ncbi:hypothetical protein LTR66_005219 [Elasticomyces elasticus]|nr:hypothetical protein LTR66_005219 [Elasticomyces elasticus]